MLLLKTTSSITVSVTIAVLLGALQSAPTVSVRVCFVPGRNLLTIEINSGSEELAVASNRSSGGGSSATQAASDEFVLQGMNHRLGIERLVEMLGGWLVGRYVT
jgi:hypothetical protein